MPAAQISTSGFGNVEPVQKLKKILDETGWEHTYDWTRQQGATLAETAKLEVQAVLAARIVIVLLPGGRGTHTELGVVVGTTLLAMRCSTCSAWNEKRLLRGVYSQKRCPGRRLHCSKRQKEQVLRLTSAPHNR